VQNLEFLGLSARLVGVSRGTIASLDPGAMQCYSIHMSTLAEIEAAADALPPEKKQELLLFLVERLRAEGIARPEPRKFSNDQVAKWIADDEVDMRRLCEGQ
jgi:hypothetical protein